MSPTKRMNAAARRRARADDGFTLIELVMTVAIVGIIAAGLTGVVISYLKHTVGIQARLTESHDVQFASAYWQRDVASIGVRSTTYDETSHSFNYEQSVNIGDDPPTPAPCPLPADTLPVVTLAWSEYTSLNSEVAPDTVKVTYATKSSDGSSPYQLIRVRCGTNPATVKVADNLSTLPEVECDGTAAKCSLEDVPAVVTMKLTVLDPEGRGTAGDEYTATLTGERRQS